jgi:sugar phosphate isomerase/epimerase
VEGSLVLRRCINPVCLPHGLTLAELITIAGHWHYEAFEFPAQAALIAHSAGELDELKGLCRRLSVEPYACSGAIPLDGVRPAELMCEADAFATAMSTMETRLTAARALGASVATLTVGPRVPQGAAADVRTEACERLALVCNIAQRCDLRVAVEFTGASSSSANSPLLYDSIDDFLELIAMADVSNRVVVDIWHWFNRGAKWGDLERLRAETVALIHISDVPADGKPPLENTRRLLPGEGILDVKAFIRRLACDAVTSIEVFDEGLRSLDQQAVCAKLDAAWRVVDE